MPGPSSKTHAEQGQTSRPKGWAHRHETSIKIVSAAAIAISLVLIARRLPVDEIVEAVSGWVQELGAWGPVVFGLVYVISALAFLPASALTLAAGAAFGLLWGTIIVSLASTAAAAFAFLIARYFAREAVARRVRRYPKFEAIDRAIGEGGWKVVAMLRLSPAVPFNLQNYLYGVTRVRFWPCILTSWVAMLPGTVMYVYLGHVGRAGLEAASGGSSRSAAEWALIVVGLVATVAVTVYVTLRARRAIREHEGIAPAPHQGEDEERRDRPAGGWPRGAMIAALGAVVAVSVAGYTLVRPEALQGLLFRLGGPPQVTLREAYAERPGGPTFDHGEFDSLLKTHVAPGGWVDYQGLSRDEAKLDAYLARLTEAPFDELGRDEKLALLLNAYNACTLRLILDHYPIDSIRSIPEAKRWQDARWKIGLHTWSLNQIEHEQIRPKFREARVHFALVCAAIGCPPLRSEAYAAERLGEQLGDQARYIHAHDRWFRLADDRSEVWLTKLYRWYRGDFEQVTGSVLRFASRSAPGLKAALDVGRSPEVRWLEYDWSLNSKENEL